MTQPNLSKPSLPPGKIIALDVGEARIGVAACDPLRLTVRPLRTLRRRNRRSDFDSLAQIYTEEEAVLIVCGLPFNMDGSEGPQARRIRNWAARFTRALRNILGNEVRLVFWDERLSSFSAGEWIAEEGPHPAGQDAVAAALILRSYLDAKNEEGSGTSEPGL